jgi:type VI secretion system secreted protein Hcp
MPIPAYLTIKGTKQSDITEGALTQASVGQLYKDDHKDEILVEAFKHEITKPTDPQSGQVTGDRVHHPIVITKVFDKSSPMLYNALCTGEMLKEVELKWYRATKDGPLEHYFTTKLEEAIIVNITAYMPNCQDKNLAHFTHLEDVSITYGKISWRHELAKTEGQDSWREAAK